MSSLKKQVYDMVEGGGKLAPAFFETNVRIFRMVNPKMTFYTAICRKQIFYKTDNCVKVLNFIAYELFNAISKV